MTDEARGLLMVAALLVGGGFAGGRMSVSAPQAVVRYVAIPMPSPLAPPAEAAPIEPAPLPPAEPAPIAPVEPPAMPLVVEAKPQPPKVEAKPKPPIKPQAKSEARSRTPAPKKSLPSCAVVQQKYNAMTWTQRMAEYHSASPEEIAYGKRCLGF